MKDVEGARDVVSQCLAARTQVFYFVSNFDDEIGQWLCIVIPGFRLSMIWLGLQMRVLAPTSMARPLRLKTGSSLAKSLPRPTCSFVFY